MTVKEMYDRVSRRLGREVDERTYLAYLGETLLELRAMVNHRYLWLNGEEAPPEEVTPEEVWCNSLFHPAIIENILYLFTSEDKYKSEFLRLTNAAEMTVKSIRYHNKEAVLKKYGW